MWSALEDIAARLQTDIATLVSDLEPEAKKWPAYSPVLRSFCVEYYRTQTPPKEFIPPFITVECDEEPSTVEDRKITYQRNRANWFKDIKVEPGAGQWRKPKPASPKTRGSNR